MPYEIRTSQLAAIGTTVDDLKTAINNHIAVLHSFNREKGKPRPVAHPVIESCIKRVQKPKQPDEYVPDYTITDDAPPKLTVAELTLDEKKQNLQMQLGMAETAAKQAIMPARKQPLLARLHNLALAKAEADRSPEENGCLEQYRDVITKFQAIELVAAQALSDIEDLTVDNVDSWLPPNFN